MRPLDRGAVPEPFGGRGLPVGSLDQPEEREHRALRVAVGVAHHERQIRDEEVDVGARGVAATTWLIGPQPTALRAATRNRYVAPFVMPVDVYARVVETPSLSDTHVRPPFHERWIT